MSHTPSAHILASFLHQVNPTANPKPKSLPKSPEQTPKATGPPELTDEEFHSIQKKAYSQVLQKKYVEYFNYKIQQDVQYLNTGSDYSSQLITHIEELSARDRQLKSTHVLITINYKPDIPLPIILKKLNKAVSKKWLTGYVYVIEQRSENLQNIGTGIHTHLLIERTSEPARIIKEFKSSFNTVCDTTNSACLNMKWTTEKQLPKIINYMQGTKEKSKTSKCLMDVQWRLSTGLEPIYSKGTLSNLLHSSGSSTPTDSSSSTLNPSPTSEPNSPPTTPTTESNPL